MPLHTLSANLISLFTSMAVNTLVGCKECSYRGRRPSYEAHEEESSNCHSLFLRKDSRPSVSCFRVRASQELLTDSNQTYELPYNVVQIHFGAVVHTIPPPSSKLIPCHSEYTNKAGFRSLLFRSISGQDFVSSSSPLVELALDLDDTNPNVEKLLRFLFHSVATLRCSLVHRRKINVNTFA